MTDTLGSFITQEPFLLPPLAAILVFFVWSAISSGEAKRLIRSGDDPDARMKAYAWTIGSLWALAAICTAGWVISGRTLAELGFRLEGGLPALGGWAIALAGLAYMVWTLIAAATSRKARASVREQLAGPGEYDLVRPETGPEHIRFQWVSLTAGITEEIVFRGFMIGVFALVLPLWAAAGLSLILFVMGHAYQGAAGMARVAVIGLVFTLVFLLSGSLWPVILLHIGVDASAGGLFRLIQQNAARDAAAEPG